MKLLEILEKYRATQIQRNKGTLFEKLVKHYLEHDAKYKNVFTNVWLWEEFPYKKSSDSGIDIVAEYENGSYCAVQCKFYGKIKK